MDLNPTEAAAFTTFKELCAKEGLLKQPDVDGEVSDGIDDDTTLLRFLRARRFNPPEALTQYKQATAFHREKGIYRLCDSISVRDYEDTRRLYPHWTGRRDKTGLPIMMTDVESLTPSTLDHWRRTRNIRSPGVDMAQRACVFYDTMTRVIFPLCSALQNSGKNKNGGNTAVTSCLCIVDASTVSLKQAWDLRDFARDVSWILATCYPESVKWIFACNVPPYFTLLWNTVKAFLDPATAEKIIVLGPSDVYPTLRRYVHDCNIPVEFGGGFVFENGMLPDIDLAEFSGVESGAGRLPPGPLKLIQDGDGRRKVIATGRGDDGVQRSEEVAVLHAEEP